MSISRRLFLKFLGIGFIFKSIFTSLELAAQSKSENTSDGIEIQKGYIVLNSETQKTMETLAEVIIPGSKAIGIRTSMIEYLKNKPGVAGYIDACLWNLDSVSYYAYDKKYYMLDKEEDRIKLAKRVERKHSVFFNQFKKLVIKLYYSHPSTWKELSYSGPPQPRGFLGYYKQPTIS